MTRKQPQSQLPLFENPPAPAPATATPAALKKPPPPTENDQPARSQRRNPSCAECGEEFIRAVSGKLWHTETETKLPLRGKRYLVPCPVTGSKDHGYADDTRRSNGS